MKLPGAQRDEKGTAFKKIIFQKFLSIPCCEDFGITLPSGRRTKWLEFGEARI
jgi:hypothetical protein